MKVLIIGVSGKLGEFVIRELAGINPFLASIYSPTTPMLLLKAEAKNDGYFCITVAHFWGWFVLLSLRLSLSLKAVRAKW